MSFHKDLTGTNIHVPYAWTYADATARLAATGFVAADVGKLALQVAPTPSLWLLTDESPITWVNAGAADSKENVIYMKSATPTVNDDNTQGYTVTDLWFYLGKIYILVVATTGAAVWRQLSGKHLLTTVNPTVNDDSAAGYALEDLWINETLGTFWICKSNAVGVAVWVQITNATVNDHSIASNRGLADQHPISAITGLVDALMQTDVNITGTAVLTNTAFGKMHYCTTPTAAYTVTLPTAVGYAGQSIGFRFASANTYIITIDGNASETINLKLTRPYVHDEYLIIISDGSNWRIRTESLIQVGCRVTKAAVQSIPNNTLTKINFDTEDYDYDSCFDSVTNYRFTPKAPGTYAIDMLLDILLVGAGNLISVSLYYSPVGTKVLEQSSYGATVTRTMGGTWKFQFNGTTDYLEGQVLQVQGAARDIQYPYLCCTRISN
jgi:hypothetical protein